MYQEVTKDDLQNPLFVAHMMSQAILLGRNLLMLLENENIGMTITYGNWSRWLGTLETSIAMYERNETLQREQRDEPITGDLSDWRMEMDEIVREIRAAVDKRYMGTK